MTECGPGGGSEGMSVLRWFLVLTLLASIFAAGLIEAREVSAAGPPIWPAKMTH